MSLSVVYYAKISVIKVLLVCVIICILMGCFLLSRRYNALFGGFVNKSVPPQLIVIVNDSQTILQSSNIKLEPTNDSTAPTPIQHNKSKQLYSSFVCIGGDTNRKINNYRKTYKLKYNLIQHSCHFKHICYSNKQNEWLYFAEPLQLSNAEIIQTENYKISTDFNTTNQGFLMMHAMNDRSVTPTIINEPFPARNNIDIYFDKSVIYHYLQWAYNFGHALTDNYYAMYRALYYFHLYSHNECCQALFNFGWQSGGFDMGIEMPLKFIHGINEYLFNHTQPIFVGYDSQKMPQKHPALQKVSVPLFESDQQDLACFSNIVLGTDDFRIWWKATNRRFHHRWDFSSFVSKIFKSNELHRDRYTQYSNVAKQKILFISKGANERRRWTNDTNVTYIIQYLQDLFGVEIEAMESSQIYNGKSLTQQIDFIIPYTLVITACGSVSYIGTFMRKGTAMITVDYWHIRANRSTHIDSYLWEFMNDRKTYYYYIRRNEWRIPPHLWRGKYGKEDVRNNADYRLKAARMSNYVYSALLWIEHYNGWNNTFTKPEKFPIHEID